MTELVIVNPNGGPKGEVTGLEPPLWALIIASQWCGESPLIVDAEAFDMNVDATIEAILALKPENVLLVAMGRNPSVSSTPKMPVVIELARTLKDYCRVGVTGLHPQALPAITERESGCEVVSVAPFTNRILRYDLLPMNKYRAHNWHCLDGSLRSPYGVTYTSISCPFDCWFCNIHTLYGSLEYELREPSFVLKDIKNMVREYNIRNIKFWDELFALKESHVLTICDGIISEGWDLNIWAYARVDTITEKMARSMSQAGIKWLAYGFETADSFTNKQVDRAIKLTRDAGINIMANFMFGLPHETDLMRQRTLEFAQSHLFEFVNFYVAMPYPGSLWYNDIQPDIPWESYDQYGQVRNSSVQFKDKAFYEYFTNPSYLSMIEGKFGRQAVDQIALMLKSKVNVR